jgi:hypothetical protein
MLFILFTPFDLGLGEDTRRLKKRVTLLTTCRFLLNSKRIEDESGVVGVFFTSLLTINIRKWFRELLEMPPCSLFLVFADVPLHIQELSQSLITRGVGQGFEGIDGLQGSTLSFA